MSGKFAYTNTLNGYYYRKNLEVMQPEKRPGGFAGLKKDAG
jgi:hypothetical protein